MILLTISIGGLQIAWSVEMSNGSPYLLSLGISKSLMALVWIAGPLSGTLVQPYVGMMSDNCRIRWGKRKPFMLGGAAATIVSLMFLAWTREIVTGVLGLFGADPQSDGVKFCVICTAVLWIYILDFAINTGMVLAVRKLFTICVANNPISVQAAIRAFIVDCAPTHQQGTCSHDNARHQSYGILTPFRNGKCYGQQVRRYRQYLRLSRRIRPPRHRLLVAWRYSVQGALRYCQPCPWRYCPHDLPSHQGEGSKTRGTPSKG